MQNCRIESQKYFSNELDETFISYFKQQLNWLLENTDIWSIACANFSGKIDKLLQFASMNASVLPIRLYM